MDKIGIVTITNGPDNYGNILQNLATQCILKNIGYKSETIQNFSCIEYKKYHLYLIPKLILRYKKAKRNVEFLFFSKKVYQV